jgi:glutathione reductase (NADPH)
MEYDVAIVGTGTAAETAAYQLADAGKKIVIVDSAPYGGTCARYGCQPKKYFVANTHLVAETRALLGKGIAAPAQIDWNALQAFKRTFTDPVPESTESSLSDLGIETLHGTASLTDDGISVGTDRIRAGKTILAAGARPRPLDIPGAEYAHTSDDFLDLETLPRSIAFIGGGYISMEFATIAAIAGSRVTILQRGDRILPQFPTDLVLPLAEHARAGGIDIRTGVDVKAISKNGDEYLVSTNTGDISTSWVISSIGRVPNLEALRLEDRGVDFSHRGITVNAHMETSVSGIYAIGDCAATKQLSPIADMEAKIAVANLLGSGPETANYEAIPSVVFTHPQLASVGMTEEAALAQGRNVIVRSGDGSCWANYRRINADLVRYSTVRDADTDEILGAHILSPYAGEQINIFALAIRNRIPASEIASLPWAYPTYTSDVKYMV